MRESSGQKLRSIGSQDAALERSWLFTFLGSLSNLSLYPPEHPRACEALEIFFDATLELQEQNQGEVVLSSTEDAALINHFTLDSSVRAFERVGRDLRERNIHTLVFTSSVSVDDLAAFCIVFSLPVDKLAQSGGLQLLLEERGVDSIHLAEVRYANAVEDSQHLETKPGSDRGKDDRILFARFDHALQAAPGGKSISVVTLLENPALTSRFLESKSEGDPESSEFTSAIREALEKAGTMAYYEQPEKWSDICSNLAEALLLMSPRLRSKVLESRDFNSSEDLNVLENIISALRPEQIARILADYLESIQNPPQENDQEQDSRQDLNILEESRARETIRSLINSPDQFEILAPLLTREFNNRGEDLLSKARYFGPLCESYFAETRRKPGDLSVSADKWMINKKVEKASRESRKPIADLLETVAPDRLDYSEIYLYSEVLRQEKDAAVYADLLAPEIVRIAGDLIERLEPLKAREALDVLIEHAGFPDGELFEGRREIAQSFLQEFQPDVLVRTYFPESAIFKDRSRLEALSNDLSTLLSMGIDDITYEILTVLLDADLDVDTLKWVVGILRIYWSSIGEPLASWLKNGHSPYSTAVRLLLQTAYDENAFPVLKYLIHESDEEIAGNAIRLIAQMGLPEADTLLLEESQGKGWIAKKAFDALRTKRSPLCVPFLAKELNRFDIPGFYYSRRNRAAEDLALIDDHSARKELERFTLAPLPIFGRRRNRKIRERIFQLADNWPHDVKKAFLEKMLKHPHEKIRGLANREGMAERPSRKNRQGRKKDRP